MRDPGGPNAKASEAAIGTMLRPTDQRAQPFARDCWRYITAKAEGTPLPSFPWLSAPVLYPKRLDHATDLRQARVGVPDLRPGETIVYASALFGPESFVARVDPGQTGADWRALDFRDEAGEAVRLVSDESEVGAEDGRRSVFVRPWAMFLGGFLRQPVSLTLDEDGHPSGPRTVGRLRPRPVRLIGSGLAGRTDWTAGRRGEILAPDPGEWTRVLAVLDGLPEATLRAAGIAPQSFRAWRAGRPPVGRNRERARALAVEYAGKALGDERYALPPTAQGRLVLVADRRRCLAPGCGAPLSGRARSWCSRHAAYPGGRRRAWKEALSA